MISVDEARAIVCQHARRRAPAGVPLSEALGLVVSEDVISSIDSPPHDKSMVDGFAVNSADLGNGDAEFVLLEEVTAGQTPSHAVVPGKATRIMTGAPIPEGADAVVMVERSEMVRSGSASSLVRIRDADVRPGQHIMRRGTAIRRGEVVLSADHTIRPVETGLLAEVGMVSVPVYPRPTVAVLATGNELVPASAAPAAGQIRNSNGPMLRALVQRAGGKVVDLGIGRDDKVELGRLVQQGLDGDVVVLSGGVSAGTLDLVPEVLQRLGVQQVFHKVKLKPGKPLWFGVLPDEEGNNKLVFGLPGNPVSTLVCFELFVRAALAKLGGKPVSGLILQRARLARDHHHRSDRLTFFPARWVDQDERTSVEALEWQGSSDLRALADADCLVRFPAGERAFAAGESVAVCEL